MTLQEYIEHLNDRIDLLETLHIAREGSRIYENALQKYDQLPTMHEIDAKYSKSRAVYYHGETK